MKTFSLYKTIKKEEHQGADEDFWIRGLLRQMIDEMKIEDLKTVFNISKIDPEKTYSAEEMNHLEPIIGKLSEMNAVRYDASISSSKRNLHLIFGGDNHDVDGGMNDLLGILEGETEEVIETAKTLINNEYRKKYLDTTYNLRVDATIDWIQVVQLEDLKIVYRYGEGREMAEFPELIIGERDGE